MLGGSRGSGTTRTKVFSLEVVAPTTTTTTTTTAAYEDDDGHYDYAEDSEEEDQDESYEEEEEEDDSDEDDHEEDEYLEYDATTAQPTTVPTDTTSHFPTTLFTTSWHPDQEQRGDTGPEYTEYQEYSDHADNSTAELDYAESSRLQVEEVRDVTLLEEVSGHHYVEVVFVQCESRTPPPSPSWAWSAASWWRWWPPGAWWPRCSSGAGRYLYRYLGISTIYRYI